MKILFLVPYPEQDATTRYRVLQFLPYLERNGISATVHPFVSNSLYKIKNEYKIFYTVQKILLLIFSCAVRIRSILSSASYDLVFIHREAFPFFTPLFEKLVHRLNPNIVFDFDDAIFSSPAHRANWRDVLRDPKRVKDIIGLSTCVIAGNDYLRSYAEQFNPNVVVIPTTLNPREYLQKRYTNSPTVVIGWIGSWGTLDYLRLLEGVFKSLAKRHDIKIKVVGARNIVSFSPKGVNVEHKLWDPDDEVSDLQSFDIGVMPLPDNEWERGKCGFKLLQYMSVGVPAVASPVGVNSEIVNDGENGFLADGDDEWIEKLGRLVQDPALRERMGRQGRKTVEKRYSIESVAPKLVQVLHRYTQT